MISETERAIYERFSLPLVLCSCVDGKAHTELVSDGMCESFRKTREQVFAMLRGGMDQYTHPDDNAWVHSNTVDLLNRRCEALDCIFRHRVAEDAPWTMIHMVARWQTMADGSQYAMFLYCDMSTTESAISRVFTQFAEADSELIYTDPATGLKNFNYNRQFSMDHVGRIRASGKTPMFIVFDLINMQGYNSNYGYTNGDKLLRIVAQELRREIVSPDAMVVRGADDEFYILDALTSPEESAEKVRAVNERIKARAYGTALGGRAGVCVFDADTRTTTAMDRARTALREIGDDMNVMCRFYSTDRDDLYWFRRYIIDSFDRALEEGWIKVFYQPILRTENRKMCGLEALARWIDPNRGMIPPNDFIPLLSRFHQTYRLDLYMVEQICKEYKIRLDEDLPLLPVSVNFSAQDFDHADIPAALDEILARHGVEHEYIIIEITEQDIATGDEHFHEQLHALRESGYRIWIDDFGSGYSSLNVFSRFDINRIKFDMELLRHLDDHNGANRKILKAFVNVCRELGVHTLCEGVETQEQYEFLKEIDCEMIQGFYFAKPRPLEDAVFMRRTGGPVQQYETTAERRRNCDAWLAKRNS